MAVGILRITLYLPDSGSLKDKRRVLRSLRDRLRGRFNVSVAEIDDLDLRQKATLAVALVSKDSRHADMLLQKVLNWMESCRLADIIDVDTEIL